MTDFLADFVVSEPFSGSNRNYQKKLTRENTNKLEYPPLFPHSALFDARAIRRLSRGEVFFRPKAETRYRREDQPLGEDSKNTVAR